MTKHSKTNNKGEMKKKSDNKETKRKIDAWVWDEVKGQAVPLTIGSIAMAISSYSNQAVPRLFGRLMDPSSTKSENSKQTSSLATSIICLGVVGGTASFIRTVSLNVAQDRLAGKFRKQTFESLLTTRDLEWFHLATSTSSSSLESNNKTDNVNTDNTENEEGKEEDNNKDDTPPTSSVDNDDASSSISSMTPAEISVILKDDVDMVAKTITGSYANLFRSCGSCCFGTYNMFCLNPSLLGLSILVAPVVGTLALISRKYMKKMLAIQHQASVQAASFLDERLNNIMMVKMSNRTDDEIQMYSQIQDRFIDSGIQSAIANGLSMGSMFALSTISLCGILLVGGRAVQSQKMTHGQLVSFGSYSFLLGLGSAGIVKALSEISKGRDSAKRLYSLLFDGSEKIVNSNNNNIQDKQQACDDVKNTDLDVRKLQSIETQNISFAYKVNPSSLVLHDISITINVGELVVIIGENGAGKSTIASLLAGLYSPTSGNIVVRGESGVTNFNDLDSETLSKLVQVVPQDPALFDATILENVRYSCPEASLENVKQALTSANCDDFISKLEGGLDYQVGRNGKRLSGGQRQRLGLARALLADPVLLVLDEPASALDAEGESAVTSAISTCRALNKAMLLVTHNSKALSSADRMLVMDGGYIVEEGAISEFKGKRNSLLSKLMPGFCADENKK